MVGRKCSSLVALGAIALCLLAPGRSSAQAGPFGPVIIGVDDGGPVISLVGNAVKSYGFDPTGFGFQITQEGIGQLGLADFHGEWFDANPLAPGQVAVVNVALLYPGFETDPTKPSDTINLTFTGHSPNGRLNNMSVDEHFRSDSLDEIPPPALANQILMFEQPGFIDLTPLIRANTGLQSFNFKVRSDVPEPGSMAMLGGIAISGGLMVWRRRRR